MDPMDSKDGASDEVFRETSKQPYRHDTEAGDVPSEAENQTYGHVDMDQDGLNTEAEVTGKYRCFSDIVFRASGLWLTLLQKMAELISASMSTHTAWPP